MDNDEDFQPPQKKRKLSKEEAKDDADESKPEDEEKALAITNADDLAQFLDDQVDVIADTSETTIP